MVYTLTRGPEQQKSDRPRPTYHHDSRCARRRLVVCSQYVLCMHTIVRARLVYVTYCVRRSMRKCADMSLRILESITRPHARPDYGDCLSL